MMSVTGQIDTITERTSGGSSVTTSTDGLGTQYRTIPAAELRACAMALSKVWLDGLHEGQDMKYADQLLTEITRLHEWAGI